MRQLLLEQGVRILHMETAHLRIQAKWLPVHSSE